MDSCYHTEFDQLENAANSSYKWKIDNNKHF